MEKLGTDNVQSSLTFYGDDSGKEMLRIARDGFYVRGVKVPLDENEARAVYDGVLAWLMKANTSLISATTSKE